MGKGGGATGGVLGVPMMERRSGHSHAMHVHVAVHMQLGIHSMITIIWVLS